MSPATQKQDLIRQCERLRTALRADVGALRLSLSWTDQIRGFTRSLVRAWPVAPALILALIARRKALPSKALLHKALGGLGIVPLLLRWWLRRGAAN
jgi:hypothetical protein